MTLKIDMVVKSVQHSVCSCAICFATFAALVVWGHVWRISGNIWQPYGHVWTCIGESMNNLSEFENQLRTCMGMYWQYW